MKRKSDVVWLVGVVVVVAIAAFIAGARAWGPASPGEDERAIRQQLARWVQACERKDVEEVLSIFSPKLRMTGSDGRTYDFQQLRRRLPVNLPHTHDLSLAVETITISGTGASSVSLVTGSFDSFDPQRRCTRVTTSTMRNYDTWEKADGVWLVTVTTVDPTPIRETVR